MSAGEKPLVYGQLGGASRVHVSGDGINVTDEAGELRVRLGRIVEFQEGVSDNDYGLVVRNPAGTVIIDGTSDMFKIAAAGTVSRASNPGDLQVTTEVTLTGLGTLASTPAHHSFISTSVAADSVRSNGYAQADALEWVATTSGGSPTARRVVASVVARVATRLNGSAQAVVELRVSNADAGALTWVGKFYVLQEVAV